MKRYSSIFVIFIVLTLFSSCMVHKKLKPLPDIDPTNPDVWSAEKCKNKPMIWWGKQGQDPSKVSYVWHCGDWIIYNKNVAPN